MFNAESLSAESKKIIAKYTVKDGAAFMDGAETSLTAKATSFVSNNSLLSSLDEKTGGQVSGAAASAVSNVMSSVANSKEGQQALGIIDDVSSVTQNAASAASNALNALTTVSNLDQEIDTLINDVIKSAIDDIKNESKAYINEKLKIIKKVDFSYMTKVMTESYKENLITMSEVLKELGLTNEEQVELDETERKIKEKTSVLDKISYRVSKISYTVNKTINDVNEGINTCMSYIARGEDFIVTQVSTYENKVLDIMYKTVGKETQVIEDWKTTKLHDMGEDLGKKMAEKTNKIIRKQLKKKKDKIDQATGKAKIKAKAKLQETVMKLKGILGG